MGKPDSANIPSTQPSTCIFQESNFSNLITMLLESNMILHREIQQMQQEHRKAMINLTQFCLKHKPHEPYSVSAASFMIDDDNSVENISVPVPLHQGRVLRAETECSAVGGSDDEVGKDGCSAVGGADAEVGGEGEENEDDAECCNRVKEKVTNATERGFRGEGWFVSCKEDIECEEQERKVTKKGRKEGERHERVSSNDEDGSTDGYLAHEDEYSVLHAHPNDSGHDYQLDCVESSTSYCRESDLSSCNEEESTTILSNSDHYESPGMEAVQKMWDNFSVTGQDYFEKPVVKLKQKKWTTRVTVPQPFSMTIREANSPTKKSRSLEIAEQEFLERKAMDDAETKKRFCATPIPASTFLPLFELSNARNEQRRETMKKECAKMLESTQKPFSFHKRDALKHDQRKESLKRSQDQEVAMLKKNAFKAKPVPPDLFDPDTHQKLLEQEEYRTIFKKMRADQLLAKSKLPSRMQESAKGSHRKNLECHGAKPFMTEEHCFHPPRTHKIPDYEQAFHRFQQQLELKKCSKCTTIAEPFQLQTDILSRRRMMQDKIQVVKEKTKLPCYEFSSTPHDPRRSSNPAKSTQTTRLSQRKTRGKKTDTMQKEIEDEEDQITKMRRIVQKEVIETTSSIEQTPSVDERKSKKMEKFR